jgi:hypothetical protein
MNVGLVMCCGLKLSHAAPARNLYQSILFKKASAYCRGQYDVWFILSALYGLVHPDQVIAPYDLTLKRLSKGKRDAWGNEVCKQLRDSGLLGNVFFIHAGRYYADPLLVHDDIEWMLPMKGLGIGKHLSWYCERERLVSRRGSFDS